MSSKYSEYLLFTAWNEGELETKVTAKLQGKGWELYGNPFSTGLTRTYRPSTDKPNIEVFQVAQAMVKLRD